MATSKKSGVSTSTSAKQIRVLVADDHPLFRDGLIQLLNRESDLHCCGETDTIAGTLAAVRTQQPDLLVLDLRLRDGEGLELIKLLQAEVPALPVLVLSQHDETLYAERVLRAGARGYLMKQEATEDVRQAIRALVNGELYVSQSMSSIALRRLIARKSEVESRGVEALSDREFQVFQSLGAGRTTRQIAEALHVSFKTIETHRENIKHKLGLPDAAALLRFAAHWAQGSTPAPPPTGAESTSSPPPSPA
jgi:DNA-binding NarL/FixJ family response regulator